jgi:hypothetical protein
MKLQIYGYDVYLQNILSTCVFSPQILLVHSTLSFNKLLKWHRYEPKPQTPTAQTGLNLVKAAASQNTFSNTEQRPKYFYISAFEKFCYLKALVGFI